MLENRGVPASLSVGDITLLEGNVGTQYAQVPVKLSAPSAQTVKVNRAHRVTVTVRYFTANGTARARTDYESVVGLLTFQPGQMTATIVVDVLGENRVEADETFFVNLADATVGTIANGRGQGTIGNDDSSSGGSGHGSGGAA